MHFLLLYRDLQRSVEKKERFKGPIALTQNDGPTAVQAWGLSAPQDRARATLYVSQGLEITRSLFTQITLPSTSPLPENPGHWDLHVFQFYDQTAYSHN